MGYNTNDIYQSNSDHLKSEDIGNDMPTYTMTGVELKIFDNGDRKLIVAFQETDKTLVLNATNARAIGDLYTPDTDQWPGNRIMLFTMPVDYQGKQTMGIRVRGPAGQSANAPINNGGQQYSEQNPPPRDNY